MKLTSVAVISLLAALSFAPPALATTDFIVDRVNKTDAAASEFFFDSGKGLFWQPGAGGTMGSRAAVDAFIEVWKKNAKEHEGDVANMSFLGAWGMVGTTKGTVNQEGIDEAKNNGISEKAVQLLVGSTSGAGSGQLTADGADCWAHASSNVLQYWQSYYGVFSSNKNNLQLGYAVKDKQTAVDLLGTQSLKLTKWFYIPSKNEGGQSQAAMISYLTDKTYSSSANTFGDYFANAYASVGLTSVSASNLTDAVFKHMDCSLVGGQVVQNSYGKLAEFTIGYADGSGVPHALTLYGFGVDDAGKVNRLYYADSDDQAYGIKTYYLKSGENGDSRVYLYSNSDYTLSSTEKLKYVYELVSIQTPDNLKEMGKQYWDGDLEWSGRNANSTVKDTWTAGEGLGSTAESLPTGDTGWRVAVNDGYYDSFFYATRNVRFNDAGIASDADSGTLQNSDPGTVKISGGVTASRMTIDNVSKKYIFKSSGSEGDSISLKELVKSGGGVAAIENLTVSTSLLSVKSGTLALESGASLTVSGTSDVVRGGTLSIQGGTASLGDATFAAGSVLSVLKASDTGSKLTASTLTFADGARFSFDLTGAGTTSSLLTIDCSNIKFGSNISFDFSNGTADSTYNLISFVNAPTTATAQDWLSKFVSYNGELSFSGNTLTLAYAAEKTATWTGNTNTWSSSSPTQWSGSPEGASVTFGSDNAGTVTVSGTVNPSAINVTGGNYVFVSDTTNPGSISGSRDITISGGASLESQMSLGEHAVVVKESSSFTYNVDSTGSIDVSELRLEDANSSATFKGEATYNVHHASLSGKLSVQDTANLVLHSDADVASVTLEEQMGTDAQLSFRNSSNSGMVQYTLSTDATSGTVNVGSDMDTFGTRLNVTSAATTYTVAKDSILAISGSGTTNFKASGEGTVLVDSGQTVTLAVSQSKAADGSLLQGTLSDVNFEVAKTAKATLTSTSTNLVFGRSVTVNGQLEHQHSITYLDSTIGYKKISLGKDSVYKLTLSGQSNIIKSEIETLELRGNATFCQTLISQSNNASYRPKGEVVVSSLTGSGTLAILREAGGSYKYEGTNTIFRINNLNDFRGGLDFSAGLSDYSFDPCNQNLVLGGGMMDGAVKLSLTKGTNWFTSLQFAISGDTQIGGVGTSLIYSAGNPNDNMIRLAGGTCSIAAPSTITTPTDGTRYTLTVKTQGSSDAYTFTGHVGEGLNLAKQGEGKQSFVGDLSKFNGDVEVKGGTLVMMSSTENSITLDDTSNTTTLNTTSLSISGGATLESNLTVKVSGAFVSKAYVSDLVGTAAAATLLLGDAVGTAATTNPVASLTADTDLSEVSSLNMETTVDLGGKRLTLWSGTKELTLSDSMFELQTDGTYKVTLFTNIGTLTGLDSVSVSADTKFTTQQGWLSDGVTLSKVTTDNSTNLVLANIQYIPEPTTATLALLGLMGLCARRRRKK